jgi:hypothetical protein
MGLMRALLVLVLTTQIAHADDACLPKDADGGMTLFRDGDDAIVCFYMRCLVVDPKTGKATGKLASPPKPAPVEEPAKVDILKQLEKCPKCAAVRKVTALREPLVAALDGKWLFEIETAYPTKGTTWNLATGKRVGRFSLDQSDDGPPPPVDFENVELIGRNAVVGDPASDYRLAFDIFTGHDELFYQLTRVSKTLVIENLSSGRVDLRDFSKPKRQMVATRRLRASPRDGGTMTAKTIVIGDKALVAVEDPMVTVLVDTTKRTVSRARPLPRCKD